MHRRLVRQRLWTATRATSSSSNQSSQRMSIDSLLGYKLRATAKEMSAEMLPALKVLSESIGLLRESPALRSWSASDWLVGLSVLAQYKTKQRETGRHNEGIATKPVVVDQVGRCTVFSMREYVLLYVNTKKRPAL